MAEDMRREFDSREAMIAYLREVFPQAQGDAVENVRGGRKAGEAQLAEVQPGAKYSKTRNYLDGGVTHLSPYIRYGVLSLAEVRDFALSKVLNPQEVEKFINELAWRDYWQRVYKELGDDIWEDREDYKTGFDSHQYRDDLPDNVRDGTTGMVCIDSFSQDLRQTGYLHNHARMWMAAYIVHWRRVKWQAGARWFLEHLLDGDPASNNLSWQWVASTFSSKPYYFNRENLQTFTNGEYCERCPLYGKCAFEGSYEKIEARLFRASVREERR
jgi:deoxyribodipyrimidine photo-lyase